MAAPRGWLERVADGLERGAIYALGVACYGPRWWLWVALGSLALWLALALWWARKL
jgi:hypothetical protein